MGEAYSHLPQWEVFNGWTSGVFASWPEGLYKIVFDPLVNTVSATWQPDSYSAVASATYTLQLPVIESNEFLLSSARKLRLAMLTTDNVTIYRKDILAIYDMPTPIFISERFDAPGGIPIRRGLPTNLPVCPYVHLIALGDTGNTVYEGNLFPGNFSEASIPLQLVTLQLRWTGFCRL